MHCHTIPYSKGKMTQPWSLAYLANSNQGLNAAAVGNEVEGLNDVVKSNEWISGSVSGGICRPGKWRNDPGKCMSGGYNFRRSKHANKH